MMRYSSRFLLIGLAAASFASMAQQGYPERPITLIVASAAGGAGDNLARGLAKGVGDRLKQPIIVENISGASGAIAVQRVLRAPADGYTLLFGTTGDMVLTPIAIRNAGYTTKDFTPIAKVSVTPMVLVAKPDLKITSFQQLVAVAKQNPGKLTIATSGNVSLSAFGAIAINRSAGIDVLSVPYKSAPPMMNDLLGGQVDLTVSALPGLLEHVRGGKLTVLGLLSEQRSPVAPDWPTLAESGLVKDVSVEVWAGVAGPGKLPLIVVGKFNRAVQETLKDKAFTDARAKLGDTLAQPAPAEAFALFLTAEEMRYRRLAVGMKLE